MVHSIKLYKIVNMTPLPGDLDLHEGILFLFQTYEGRYNVIKLILVLLGKALHLAI